MNLHHKVGWVFDRQDHRIIQYAVILWNCQWLVLIIFHVAETQKIKIVKSCPYYKTKLVFKMVGLGNALNVAELLYLTEFYNWVQWIFSVWGNVMSPLNCFWHLPSFIFYTVILSPGTNEIFYQTDWKKSNWPALRLLPNVVSACNVQSPSDICWWSIDHIYDTDHTI